MRSTPPEAAHLEFTNGGHTVFVAPIRWAGKAGSKYVTEACAYCKTCGWDTPLLFSLGAAKVAARRHVGLITSEIINKEQINAQ